MDRARRKEESFQKDLAMKDQVYMDGIMVEEMLAREDENYALRFSQLASRIMIGNDHLNNYEQ
jgi:hypothetical protein